VIGVCEFDAETLWWNNYISMCSLVRRSALPLDLMARTDFLEDWRLWLHMASRGHRFVAVDEVLFDAMVRPQGKSAHIESHAHRRAVEIANLRRPYANLIGCDQPISVVIPATDSADLTCECLWHLARYTGLPLHAVYIDNGSQRGTIERVEQAADMLQLPLEVIANRANRGFTTAVNQGIGASIGRHVLCLNNDCFVGPQCIDRMFWQLTRADERIAAVGPLSGDDSRHSLRQPWLRDEAGIERAREFDYNDAVAGFQVVNTRRRRRQRAERTPHGGWRQDHLLAFFCTLLHRDALAECGRLEERTREFRSGLGADDDWCHRVSAANWQLRISLDAYAVHLGSRTFHRLGIDRRGLQQQALHRLKSFDYSGQ
jgi:GT2 family glycosyltransferase